MADRYQHARRTETIDWSKGRETFAEDWEISRDLLRFHRGKGFTIRQRGMGAAGEGPEHTLKDLPDRLEPKLRNAPNDSVFIVRAVSDSYELLVRKTDVAIGKGQLVLDHAWNLIGTPYKFGFTDCSWLTMTTYGREGFDMPHNAHAQHGMAETIEITRKDILPGDLLFHHNDDHVSLFLDNEWGGRVIDTEPSNTTAPWGGWLGTGVRVRPMSGNYYCSWSNVNGICRVVKINGRP